MKTGKESSVFFAPGVKQEGGEGGGGGGERGGGGGGGGGCAVKIFKTSLNEFSNRAAYVDGDPRFGKLLFNKV